MKNAKCKMQNAKEDCIPFILARNQVFFQSLKVNRNEFFKFISNLKGTSK